MESKKFTFHTFKDNGKGWFKCIRCEKETDQPENWTKDGCFLFPKKNTKTKKKLHNPSWI